MNIKRLLLLLPAFLMIGCETVERARRAQSSGERQPGETSVTAAQAGLTTERPFTLIEFERVALEHHPALLSAREAVESARLQLRMTHAGRLPQFAAGAAYTRSTQNAWGRSAASEAHGSWSAGIGLDLLLCDFGRLDAAERQNLEAIIAAEQSLRDSELETVHAVRAAFFERLRSVHLMRVASESEKQYAQHLEEARIMTEIGTRRQYDVTKAEVDWALGLAENPDYPIEPGELPAARRHPDDLLADARFNAPSLAVLRARERTASAYVDQTIADLYPEFSIGADADLSGRGFPFVWNLSGALRAAQNLFDGHRKTARIDEAVTQLRRARAAVAEAEQTLYLNLVTAVAERESARKRADIARLIQKQAEDNLAIVNEQYRVGISSSIERTDAQVALTQAQADVIRAAYDEQAAIARIARLTGEPVTR